MIIIGKNGQTKNMKKETIVIFEDSENLDELLQLQKTQNVKIISMNYSSHKLLEEYAKVYLKNKLKEIDRNTRLQKYL